MRSLQKILHHLLVSAMFGPLGACCVAGCLMRAEHMECAVYEMAVWGRTMEAVFEEIRRWEQKRNCYTAAGCYCCRYGHGLFGLRVAPSV